MSEPFLGEIRVFGFNFNPRDWAKCDGQLLQISQFNALFALLGTTYGGDGRTTFGLPDLRGRAPFHQGTGPGLTNRRIGERGGEEQTTLAVANLPPHNHTASLNASTANTNLTNPANAALGTAREDTYLAGSTLDTSLQAGSVTTGNTGSGTPVDNLPPYLVLNWCIALQGVFPTRP